MKLGEKSQQKSPENSQKTSLWKKIGKAPKIENCPSEQQDNMRYDTSLQLELLAKQKNCNEGNDFLIQRVVEQGDLSKSFWAENQDFQNLISAQKIKIAESIYKIQTTDQITQSIKNEISKTKKSKTQFLVSLKEQIKLLIQEFMVFKKQISRALQKYCLQVQNIGKLQKIVLNYKQNTTEIERLNQQELKLKLISIRRVQDKLLFIQKESIKIKNLISQKETQLLNLKQDSRAFEKLYLNIKFSLKGQKKKCSLTIAPQEIFLQHKRNSLTPRSSRFSKRSELSSDQSLQCQQIHKSQRMDRLKSSQQIQQLKNKLYGLKMKITKTSSLMQ